MADVDTDEVYDKIRLIPVSGSGEFNSFDDEDTGSRTEDHRTTKINQFDASMKTRPCYIRFIKFTSRLTSREAKGKRFHARFRALNLGCVLRLGNNIY
ncbi:hypothetical protein L2E82_36222 [Cichorium intybus]|uniref:Uncharacterized protein n=1 Tax=Cichorium intybus TaxID=13427 RepID=A0ACB9BQY0_CICIN|nr:hypothetical protein L2E82_36222 [Cichorium intybus]